MTEATIPLEVVLRELLTLQYGRLRVVVREGKVVKLEATLERVPGGEEPQKPLTEEPQTP